MTFMDFQNLSRADLDLRIANEIGAELLGFSPTSDCVLFCSLLERYGIAVYPTNAGDDSRGPSQWHGQSYESVGIYLDPDMKVAGCRAILRKLLEIKERNKERIK